MHQYSNIKLLIVEDSKEDAELLVHFLNKKNFTISYTIVETAEDMQTELDENEYDLVISDFSMPKLSGLDALKVVKSHDSLLPFILISGYINQRQESEILEHGANEVIMKNNLNRLPFAVLRILHEIGDKRKLRKLIYTKDKLFSVMAHDLRGTLEGIHILAKTMQSDIGKPEAEESLIRNLNLIAQSAQSTNQLLGNLLKWALMQIGSFKPVFKEMDLQKCLQKCIQLHHTNAKRKNLIIEAHTLPNTIFGDDEMISIVFRNLISNAINYSMPDSTISVNVEDENGRVIITIADQGIGMPEEVKSRLFDPADRPKRPGTDNEKSTGFGLLLCHDIVKMHGGEIKVESEVNNGSRFKVFLPRNPTQTQSATA